MPTTKSWNTYRGRTTNRGWSWSGGTRGGTTSRTTVGGGTTGGSGWPCNSPKFSPVRSECETRIASYRNIYSQCSGVGRQTAFSPTTANRWVKFINSGARVYKFSSAQFSRYFGSQWTGGTPTTCFRYLRQRFGTGIKAVTRGKGNCWLVCASSSVTARPFATYNWK